MKIVNANIVDLDGKVIKAGTEGLGNSLDLTVAVVLVNCALAPVPQTQQGAAPARKQTDIAWRYDLALAVHKAKIGDEIELTPEQVVALKDDLLRLYTPIVCGQMLIVLDGKTVN
jgi:hypothetical protein